MPRKISPNKLYDRWLRKFSADAGADDAREIQRHIDYLQLGCSRADLIEGTDLLIVANLAYLSMDGRDCERFIKCQKYWLCGEGLPHYVLTFALGKKHFGRLLSDRAISDIDFADLFDHPWYPYETVGFHEVHISRLDGEPMDVGEIEELELRFTKDMYYDYTDEELSASVQSTELDDTALASACET